MNIWKYIYRSFQFFLILSEKYAILFRMIDIFEWKDFQNHLNFEISYDTFFFCIFYMSNIVTASFSFTRSVKRAEKINFGKSKVPQAHCMNVLSSQHHLSPRLMYPCVGKTFHLQHWIYVQVFILPEKYLALSIV